MRIGFRERRRGTLEKILAPKRAEVARMRAGPRLPPRRSPGGGVLEALSRPPGASLRLLAEIKMRSPSAGELSSTLAPADRALAYARAGATAVSVLTDGPFFGGSFDDLGACRDALDREFGRARPRLLCKEFVIHEVQLDRAVDAGADLVLLIARIVSPERLVELSAAARERGLEPLVEVAAEGELEAAFATRAALIGVNARDLNTLKMDAERAKKVLAAIDDRAAALHLSGLSTPDDVRAVAEGCAHAALVGQALMKEADPTELLVAMLGAARTPRVNFG